MRDLAGFWRRSIQARVVTSTVLLSAMVISLTGWALLRDVADGLADSRRQVAVAEATSGFELAQQQLDVAVESDGSAQSQALTEMIDTLTGSRGEFRSYQLVLEGPLAEGLTQIPVRSSAAIAPGSLPTSLSDKVAGQRGMYWSYSSLGLLSEPDRTAGIVVGSQLQVPSNGDRYALYYLFSMEDQQHTLDLVRNALALGGLAMVLMVGGVAWLVSRQVINPVRLARRIAERYAAGNFEQRMHVSGEDDIARLSTGFNQMAASLQIQIRRLENLSRLQQRFVSDVSHELRTPLTTVRMASEVLHANRAAFDPHTRRSAELLQAELDRFEDLLTDLLEISKFDAGAVQLDLDTVDLVDVARRASTDPAVERSGADLVIVNGDGPALVEADVRRIDRIVRNLVENAMRYSGSKRIEIHVAHNSDCASLAVRDFGVGLENDETSLVFNRFWRADPARTQGGTGLGLAIAREDAELHGGTLRAYAVKEEGTQFLLTLPLASGDSVNRPAVRPGVEVTV